MTEVNAEVQTQEVPVSDVSETPVTPEVTEVKETASEPVVKEEKMIPQSQVNRIAAREARAAAEKARRDMMAEFQAHQAQQQSGNANADDQMISMTPAQLTEHIKKVAHEMSVQSVAEKMAQDFETKINSRIDADPEFETKYKALDIEKHPELILWTNGLDNTADVIADIADHPGKMAQVLMLAKSGFPHLAQQELGKLSASIKANKDAQKQPSAKEPLSQIKPSNIGTVDDHSLSVSDFRKIFRG